MSLIVSVSLVLITLSIEYNGMGDFNEIQKSYSQSSGFSRAEEEHTYNIKSGQKMKEICIARQWQSSVFSPLAVVLKVRKPQRNLRKCIVSPSASIPHVLTLPLAYVKRSGSPLNE